MTGPGASYQRDLERIERALSEAALAIRQAAAKNGEVRWKKAEDPVTAADLAANEVLHRLLPEDGDGWLSEESADDASRLGCRRVWVVDPLDGTREFVADIPEWCVSVGLVVEGEAVAGGVFNPATKEMVLGAVGAGVRVEGPAPDPETGENPLVLASRSEVKRGEWERFGPAPLRVKPVGSVAYKLGLVAAGRADVTWTLVPKHEWDVAAGVALVRAAGGAVRTLAGNEPTFNRAHPKLDGLLACADPSTVLQWARLTGAFA